jgi:hypothetical protein
VLFGCVACYRLLQYFNRVDSREDTSIPVAADSFEGPTINQPSAHPRTIILNNTKADS